jgi:uncharacterized integral membrane protein
VRLSITFGTPNQTLHVVVGVLSKIVCITKEINMTDALIWALAFGGVIAVAIYSAVLVWLFIQEMSDDK